MTEKDLRNAIRQQLAEAFTTAHAVDRTLERFLNQADIRPEVPHEVYELIMQNMTWVKQNIKFNPDKGYQVHLMNLPNFYQHWEPGKDEASSQGDMVYALIRKNKIVSVFFRRKPQRFKLMPAVDEEVSVEQLMSLPKAKDGKVHFNTMPQKQGPGSRKKYVLDLPVVTIQGKEWFVDEEKNRIIYTKNIKRTLGIDDALEQLPEEEAEKIFDQSSWVYPETD